MTSPRRDDCRTCGGRKLVVTQRPFFEVVRCPDCNHPSMELRRANSARWGTTWDGTGKSPSEKETSDGEVS